MADLLDIVLPDELLPEDPDGLDDIDLDDEAPESPYRATHEGGQHTAETPYRAAEPPNRAASALSSASPSSLSFSPSLLQSGPESHSRSGPGETINDFQDLEEPSPSSPLNDKRHHEDSGTRHGSTAPREEVDDLPLLPEETAPKAPPLPSCGQLLDDLRDVPNPDSGRWERDSVELIRANYGKYDAYSPAILARHLESEVDLPFVGREDELAQCLTYIFWEWDNVPQGAEVAA